MFFEEIVKSLAINTQQFQQETRASIQNLENYMSPFATSLSRLESQGKLFSQTEVNPFFNVSMITLRSDKELQDIPHRLSLRQGSQREAKSETLAKAPNLACKENSHKAVRDYGQLEPLTVKSPFPERFDKVKKEKEDREILEISTK